MYGKAKLSRHGRGCGELVVDLDELELLLGALVMFLEADEEEVSQREKSCGRALLPQLVREWRVVRSSLGSANDEPTEPWGV